ncbi:hypothetical protein O3G_MSEX015115, partial [Manduca sexta]
KHISPESPERRKLSVHVISVAEGGAGSDDGDQQADPHTCDTKPQPVKITDLVEFKARRRLYPQPAPFINIPRKGAHCKL